MPRFKQINNERIQLTAEEEAVRDNEEAQATINKQTEIDAKNATINKKTSGRQKLKDLGLDDDEINALMGV
jgi:hypothetical protein